MYVLYNTNRYPLKYSHTFQQITAVGTKSYSPAFGDVKKITVSVDMSTSGNVFQTVLTGLIPGTNYSITVAAINGAGLGESSVQSESMTNNGKHMHIEQQLYSIV